MTTNHVLQYAIDHRAEASRLLLSRSIPLDDVDDLVHDAMVRVLQANPTDINCRSYWMSALHSARCGYWRRRHARPVSPFAYGEDGSLLTDMEDPRQDCERQVVAAEGIREAWALATPTQREAIRVRVATPVRHLPNWTTQRLHHLHKRLQRAVA